MPKFFFFLVRMQTLLLFLTFAVKGHGQILKDVFVSSNWNDVPLEEVFFEIQQQSDFYFTYNYEFIKNISVSNQNEKIALADLLKFISRETGFKFLIKEEIIYVQKEGSFSNPSQKRQKLVVPSVELLKNDFALQSRKAIYEISMLNKSVDRVIRGIVVDESGEPLIGATVVIKDTGQGTITDEESNFSIALPDGGDVILNISYVGYQSMDVPVSGSENIKITMFPDLEDLSEVVVIGYGSQSKVKVNGATGNIDGEEINKYTSGNFDQQLIGRLSGVQVNEVNGQPGSDAQIVIRGLGTLTAGAYPLVVIDEVPLAEGSTLSAINPTDIAKIDVLKDAASAAIYGSRASNGVILITTKSGQKGKMQVSLNLYSGIQRRADNVELADAYSAAQFFTEARDWGYVSRDPQNRRASDDEATRIANGANKRELRLDYLEPYLAGDPGLTNTNWLDLIYRDAQISNVGASFSGGNDNGNYYVSANYFAQEGIARGTNFERLNAVVKINSKIGKRVNFGFSLNPSYSIQDYTNLGDWRSDPIAASMIYYPFFDPYKQDGTIAISQGQILNAPADGSLQENPLAYVDIKDERQRFRTFGNTFLDIEIWNGLNFKMVLGGDFRNHFFDFFKPSTIGEYRAIAPVPAKANETNGRTLSYLSENLLTFKKTFNSHELDVLAGYTYQKENGNNTFIVGSEIQDDLLDNIAGASSFTIEADRYRWVQISYFGRLQYFYKDKYQLSAATRRDGSSRFGDDAKWGIFPSISTGWIVSDEAFFPQSKLLTFLKMRASWGKTGNNQIGSYSSKALISGSNYVYGGDLGPGFASSTSPNNALSWETNTAFNIGIDFGLLEKITLSTNYYRSITSDLLLSVPVPQQSGFSTSLQNIGEVENKGFELELSGDQINLGPVKWSFGINLTTNRNEVLSLAEGQEEIRYGRSGAWRTKVGGPIADITAYNIIGVFKTAEEIEAYPHLNGTLTGDLIVEDVNGDGQITEADQISFGTFTPELTFGLSSNFQYQNFDLSLVFNGIDGRSAYFYDEAVITGVGEGFGTPSKYYMDNRYHPENNPDGFLGQPNLGNFSSARRITRVSSQYIQDADYFRLRLLQLGYTFPEAVVSNWGISKLRLYASANNLFTITNYRGYNPDSSEFRTNTDVLRAGYAQDNYPMTQTFIFGLNLNF